MKKTGSTITLSAPPTIFASASVVGAKEGEGPLKAGFDYISDDSYFGESSWEKAESSMFRRCFTTVCDKAKIAPSELDFVCAGDLLNQCIGSAFALKDSKVPPLEYGGQRTPTSQWTVTGSGAVILGNNASGPQVTHVTIGSITDAGITDANNMGAAMAPAAYSTLKQHFQDTGRDPFYYDAIFTGDLGAMGHDILQALFREDGVELGVMYLDCGMLIYDVKAQDVHAGGSGCGCSASVLAAHILPSMRKGIWNRVLFAATGALMSATSAQQGDSIPGICHAVAIENPV